MSQTRPSVREARAHRQFKLDESVCCARFFSTLIHASLPRGAILTFLCFPLQTDSPQRDAWTVLPPPHKTKSYQTAHSYISCTSLSLSLTPYPLKRSNTTFILSIYHGTSRLAYLGGGGTKTKHRGVHFILVEDGRRSITVHETRALQSIILRNPIRKQLIPPHLRGKPINSKDEAQHLQ